MVCQAWPEHWSPPPRPSSIVKGVREASGGAELPLIHGLKRALQPAGRHKSAHYIGAFEQELTCLKGARRAI